jgi:hypothetical protein
MHGSFSERMAAAKAVACTTRYRGGFTGKAAAGWQHVERPAPDAGSWERLVAETRARWQETCSQERAEYDWQVRLEFIFIDGVGHVPF